MDIGWCVCDLDGTLLDSHGHLGRENILALQQLMDKGVEVILATGRTDLFVRGFVETLGVRQPVISCNGGMIRNVATGETVLIRPIGSEKSAKVANYCLKSHRDTLVYTSDQIFFFRGSRKISSYNRYNTEVEAAFQIPLREIARVEDLPLSDVLKFFISGIDPEIAAAIGQEINAGDELYMVQSMQDVLDIMAKGVSKGNALVFLADKIGMNLARTAVFGDNHNDLSMMSLAGCPIAVANAEPEVRKAARFIAPSNDESGVAYAIHNYILEG